MLYYSFPSFNQKIEGTYMVLSLGFQFLHFVSPSGFESLEELCNLKIGEELKIWSQASSLQKQRRGTFISDSS
jgi:hypothetical protein